MRSRSTKKDKRFSVMRSSEPGCRGFTLIELLLTVVIGSILLGIGMPSFKSFVQNSRVTTQTNEFVTAVNTSRSEAIKRSTPITLCASTDGATCAGSNNWATGWIIFTDSSGTAGVLDSPGDTLLRAYNALDGNNSLTTTATVFVRYLQSGALSGSSVEFKLQPHDCGEDEGKKITLNRLGYVRVATETCSAPLELLEPLDPSAPLAS